MGIWGDVEPTFRGYNLIYNYSDRATLQDDIAFLDSLIPFNLHAKLLLGRGFQSESCVLEGKFRRTTYSNLPPPNFWIHLDSNLCLYTSYPNLDYLYGLLGSDLPKFTYCN